MTQNTGIQATPFLPDFADLMFTAMLFSTLASGGQMLSIDSDLGRHLTLGHYILDERMIPTRDLFSHTQANSPRPPYEWLSQIVFALAERVLGLDGVILFTAISIAITFTLVFQFANRRSKSPILAFVITFLAAVASSLHWLPRPHILTFLLLTLWIERLEQVRRGNSVALYSFPLIMLLWANLHGGFIFGILAWAAYMAGWLWEKWRGGASNRIGTALLTLGLLSLIATVITPDLWRNWEAVLSNRSVFILSRTVETMPPDLAEPAILPFTLLLALTIILVLWYPGIPAASHYFLLAGLGALSLLMARNIPLFALACAPILSELASAALMRRPLWPKLEERFVALSNHSRWPLIPLTALLCTTGYLGTLNLKGAGSVFQFNPQVFPVQALDWLEHHPQAGNMLNEFNWGGYILYRSWPAQRVFLDSQSDFYGEDLMREYEHVLTLDAGWEEILEKYEVNWIVMPGDAPLVRALSTSNNWETAYKDTTAIVMRRK